MAWSSKGGRCQAFDKRNTIAKRLSTIRREIQPHLKAFNSVVVLTDNEAAHIPGAQRSLQQRAWVAASKGASHPGAKAATAASAAGHGKKSTASPKTLVRGLLDDPAFSASAPLEAVSERAEALMRRQVRYSLLLLLCCCCCCCCC